MSGESNDLEQYWKVNEYVHCNIYTVDDFIMKNCTAIFCCLKCIDPLQYLLKHNIYEAIRKLLVPNDSVSLVQYFFQSASSSALIGTEPKPANKEDEDDKFFEASNVNADDIASPADEDYLSVKSEDPEEYWQV